MPKLVDTQKTRTYKINSLREWHLSPFSNTVLIGSLLRDRAFTLAVSFDFDIFENSPNVCDCFVVDVFRPNGSDVVVGDDVTGVRYSSE